MFLNILVDLELLLGPFLATGEEFPTRSRAKTVSYACDIILPTEQVILATQQVFWA